MTDQREQIIKLRNSLRRQARTHRLRAQYLQVEIDHLRMTLSVIDGLVIENVLAGRARRGDVGDQYFFAAASRCGWF